MSDWVVRRWARYGHERLYAETSDGAKLGHLDLKTGLYHADDPSTLPLLQEAIGQHLANGGEAAVVPPPPVGDVAPVPETRAAEAESTEAGADAPGWTDLSETRAGAAARERALAAREEQGWFKHGLARLVGARTHERAWRLGADGEEAVAEELGRLGAEWHVLHAVPVGDRDSDIDHVVIGPAGVFTVNAKHHPHSSVWVGGDTVMVNGQRVPYVRNSRHEAKRAARLLTDRVGFPVTVLGVIAVVGAHKGLTIKKQPEDGRVVVVQRRRISRWLRRLPTVLDDREIAQVVEVARRSTTWRP